MGHHRKHDKVSGAKHSLNPDRPKQPKGSTMRTKATIKRLNMYRNFKARRDKTGKIIRPAPFQSTLPSGSVSRVEPNRRWFGNTRVISQDALQKFKEAMKTKNPYEIILRQTKLPVSLLDEKKIKTKPAILSSESYSYTFGSKAQRKRPVLPCEDLTSLAHRAESVQHLYDSAQDRHCLRDDDGVRTLVSQPQFKAGKSKRLWNELFKVLDSSDVVLYVLDARDPMGTRSSYIENYLRTEKPHKHFIFVLNKIDLVPVWITKRWKAILSQEYPTMIFHANMNKPIGRVALMGLLRQLYSLHSKHRPQISVGIIGYPNVGKSSIINALRNKKVCNVAPLAGETKVWQYVNLMKSIFLIDCPGVVYPDGATEAELVMKGVVRVEYLQQPDLYIRDVLNRVQPDYLQKRYNLPPLPVADTSENNLEKAVTPMWDKDVDIFLEIVSRQTGKLLKGGDPDLMTTAKRVLNDFQRGKLPYFVSPPVPEREEGEPEVEFTEDFVKDLTATDEDDSSQCLNPPSPNTTTVLEKASSIPLDANEESTLEESEAHCPEHDTCGFAWDAQLHVTDALSEKQRRRLELSLRRHQGHASFPLHHKLRGPRVDANTSNAAVEHKHQLAVHHTRRRSTKEKK